MPSKLMQLIDRFLGVPSYESEFTQFMRDYLETHPEASEDQKRGRAIWWDKKPGDRAPSPPMRHAPRSGGAEHTFQPSGGFEWSFAPDDLPPNKPPQ